MTRIAFVANPASGRATWHDDVRALAAEVGAVWWATREAGHGTALAAEAARDGFTRVVAVGGDGTIREVVAGLPSDGSCALAIVPAGTGNDLARSLAVPLDPLEAARLAVSSNDVRRLDLVRAHTADGRTVIGANMAVGGLAGTVGQRVSSAAKEQLGPLAYLGQALLDLPDLRPYHVRVVHDGEAVELDVIGGVVANGRTAGGGYRAAPGADLEDGLLDLVLVRPVGPLDLAALAARLRAGDLRRDADVLALRAARLRIDADPPMPFNLDGDPLGASPLTFEAMPGALAVVVGPTYRAATAPPSPVG